MSTYSQIAWLPLCGGLTGLGLVGSWIAWRRRGFMAAVRGVAWSLLPLAAYLTGAIEMLWKIGTAIGNFATSFAFSPEKWVGIAVTGLAFVLFVVSGMLRARRPGKVGRGGKSSETGKAEARQVKGKGKQEISKSPATQSQALAGVGDDDDFSEIEKILRSRGIS